MTLPSTLPMSLIDRALAEVSLDGWLSRRLRGDLVEADRALLAERLDTLDVLLLGALADRVRRAECGDVVRIHLRKPSEDPRAVALPPFDALAGGVAFVRSVARARLLGPVGARLRIDVDDVGLQLAQVALAFGGDELVAPTKRLLTVDDAVLRERELAALVTAGGRTPRIVDGDDDRLVDGTSSAKKKFRAPGRDVPVRREGEP